MKHPRLVLAVALILCADTVARGQDNDFTAHHVAELRSVVAAAVSPDGAEVAYVLAVPRRLPAEKDGPAWTELHVVDARGNARPFITGQVNVDAVAWTPDGKSISFLAKRDKDTHRALYVVPLRGGESRKVLEHGSDIQSYSWLADGKRIAFLATEPQAKEEKALQDQGFNQEIYEEDARPILLWISALDGKKAVALTESTSASELHAHPKQDRLASALAPTPLVDDHLMFRKVHVTDLTKSRIVNLKNPGKMGQIAWAPDSNHLALITGFDKHDPREGRLWLTSNLPGEWLDLLPDYEGHVSAIGWKDGSTLLYVGGKGVWTEVGSIRLAFAPDGKPTVEERKTLVPTGGPILHSLSVSRDGKTLAFVGDSPTHPPEVYLLGPGEKQPRRLTDSNPWLKGMRFAKQEVVKFKARDGLELEGILVRPLDEKKGQRYPLVLTVHGGPEAHVSNGWSTLYHSLGQVGAARGMAVFYPNYRGSTGRGVAFSMLGQKAAAGKEFDDLVDAVDHLIGTGLVDGKKVGITGGSYGGYATAWGATYYSDRFAAGVMFVGLSNNLSVVGTSDIPYEMYLVHHRKWLWEDPEYFLKSSPIHHVDKAKTPLLILHGKSDPRVHPSQSLELYRHLKVRGKAPVRLVLYPGEGHGNRRAASRLDYTLRLVQWMEHYLKGPGGAMPPARIDYGTSSKGASAAAGASWRMPRHEEEACWLSGTALVGSGCPCCLRSWP